MGDRAFVCIIEAASNDEADCVVRDMPAGPIRVESNPLQSIETRRDGAEGRSNVEGPVLKPSGERYMPS